MPTMPTFGARAATVIAFAIAMAYLESAVVLYLTLAIGGTVGSPFPLQPAHTFGNLGWVEVGREAATLVMIATVGLLAGRGAIERLAWSAVVFGVWDIGYYVFLWLFAGWPDSPLATDLLFLIPVPWAGPVWSPVVVSLALVGFGLAAARRASRGERLGVRPIHVAAALLGGLVVVLSYTLGAADVLDGGMPGPYPWPVFVVGMGIATVAAVHALRATPTTPDPDHTTTATAG